MSVKRVVDTSFWSDDKVIDNFSPEDKLFMLYLLTNPHTTQLGIYSLSRRQAAFEIGWSVETIDVLLDRFERVYKIIKWSPATNEVAILNFLRYSILTGGKPVADLLQKEIASVKDKSLLVYVARKMLQFENINATVKEVCEKILLKEKESIKEKEENQNQKQNDNDNDNDNDKSSPKSLPDLYHDSYNDTSTNRTTIRRAILQKPNEIAILEKSKPENPKPKTNKIQDEFNQLWQQYPNKQGKQKAFIAYQKAIKNGATFDEIMQGIQNYKFYIEQKAIEQEYIKHGSTWFNQRGWEDDYTIIEREPIKKKTRYETIDERNNRVFAEFLKDEDLSDLPQVYEDCLKGLTEGFHI